MMMRKGISSVHASMCGVRICGWKSGIRRGNGNPCTYTRTVSCKSATVTESGSGFTRTGTIFREQKSRIGGRTLIGNGNGNAKIRRSSHTNQTRQPEQKRGLLTQSHAIGPSEPPLLPHTIPQHFSSIVSQHGNRPALISRSQNTRLTYRELDERSTALAHALRERGVRKGDRVAVSLGNGWECGVVSYGVWKVGGVLVSSGNFFGCALDGEWFG
ncbi:hypothetical protein WAI453_011898 [Rhynchosporium graminicola]